MSQQLHTVTTAREGEYKVQITNPNKKEKINLLSALQKKDKTLHVQLRTDGELIVYKLVEKHKKVKHTMATATLQAPRKEGEKILIFEGTGMSLYLN